MSSVLLLAGSVFMCPHAVSAEAAVITSVTLEIDPIICGTMIENGGGAGKAPRMRITDPQGLWFSSEPKWVVRYDEDFNLWTGEALGGDLCRGYVKVKCPAGYRFDTKLTKLYATDTGTGESTKRAIVAVSDTEITIWADVYVQHAWTPWETITEPSKSADGVEKRFCPACEEEATRIIPRQVKPYSHVYEPDTSWAMSATVAWNADQSVFETAQAEVRPATVFVWPDKDLKIYDRNGKLLSESIDDYVEATHETLIPAFYVHDAQTAAALKAWIAESGLIDCFIVSDPEHKDLVKDIADLTYIRGMLDYSSLSELGRSDITGMAAAVNGAHGKTVIISQEAADKKTVQKLQSLAATVWVKTDSDLRSLITVCTYGVNGIVTDDYEAALNAEEFFHDDAPVLLRTPLILGHRGDPSVYPENTLESAKGAYEEGVDAVENDIQLSADGKLFIMHDLVPTRFLRIRDLDENGDVYPSEHYTLAELQAHPYNWDDILEYNEVNVSKSRDGSFVGQKEQKVYRIPTLEDYIRAFQNTPLVHDTEIKSKNPEIIPVFRDLVDQYDAWDQFFCITFNTRILKAIYTDYPEISIGMLCYGTTDSPLSGMEGSHSFEEIEQEKGPEQALLALYAKTDIFNATYNPMHLQYGAETVKAGRHRGLTVWPWTYYEKSTFAKDFLTGVHGMTVDNAWIMSSHIREIPSGDITLTADEEIAKPVGITRDGKTVKLDDAELVTIENISKNEQLVMWKYKQPMDLDGKNFGSYYLYSVPFVLTVQKGAAAAAAAGGTSGNMPLILLGVLAVLLGAGIALTYLKKQEVQERIIERRRRLRARMRQRGSKQ